MTNPLLIPCRHPRFDEIRAEHAVPALEAILARADEEVTALEASLQPTWEGLMAPLYRIHEPLDFAWSLVHHYLAVLNSPAWREAEEKLQPQVVAYSLRVSQSRTLYDGLCALRDSPAWDTLSGPRRRILESAIRSARLGGVGLPPAQREEFAAIHRELAQAGTRFQNNLLDATKAFALELTAPEDIEGLPSSLLAAAAQAARAAGRPEASTAAGPWRVSLEASSFLPFMKYSRRRDLRERLYRAFVTRASEGDLDNQPLIARMLELRARMAAMLGFETYARMSLESKMAPGVEAVDALHERLRAAARPAAIEDLKDLARADGGVAAAADIRPWDVAFLAERLREERYRFNDEDLRPYFQFERVLEGMFDLAARLFDVRIRPADGEVPVWHPDVRFFRVTDADGTPLASFYLDPFSRPETKRGGAWMNPFAPRQARDEGRVDLPVAHLVCNQTPPVDGRPSSMTPMEVTTLFHEFGHALQHLLTMVDEPEASGLHNIEWDAVEIASQFMENWCRHADTLRGLSRHADTGSPLPEDLLRAFLEARNFRAGSDMLRQLYFGILDIELHHRHRSDGHESVRAVEDRIAALATVIPRLPEDRSLCGFSHVFGGGYAAGYYSYKWSEVLSADAFAAFEEAGLDQADAQRRVGRRYRDTILALGGGTHPMDVFRAFRGRDPDPDALLRQSGLLARG
jgi:oligopeptidase A